MAVPRSCWRLVGRGYGAVSVVLASEAARDKTLQASGLFWSSSVGEDLLAQGFDRDSPVLQVPQPPGTTWLVTVSRADAQDHRWTSPDAAALTVRVVPDLLAEYPELSPRDPCSPEAGGRGQGGASPGTGRAVIYVAAEPSARLREAELSAASVVAQGGCILVEGIGKLASGS
jgi:hypothetical protein